MSKSQQLPNQQTPEQYWAEVLPGLDQDELAELARRTAAMDAISESKGPQTEDELWELFRDKYNVELPRVAVCPGHSSQFEVVCDIYFYRILHLLWIVNRGGGKTSTMAWIHDASAENFPGYKGLTVGASLTQGERMYEHLLPYVVEGGVIGGRELPHIARSIEKKTAYNNTSAVEIAPATIASVNGPRVPRLHRDEVEIMWREKPDVYKQASNIPASSRTKDGRKMPAQIIDTSTMKWAHGLIALTKKAYDEAISKGKKPAQVVKVSCIFEAAEEVPNCQKAPDGERRARLEELGKDPCSICDCHEVVKGTWDDEKKTERTLADVCAGRFFRSRGFKPRSDIIMLFSANERREWEAEQECSRPSGEGLYIPSFDKRRHGLRRWSPDPDRGFVYQAVDWGGDDPHSVGWYQILDQPFQAELYEGGMVTMPKGARVRFSEINVAGIGNVALGERVVKRENDRWRATWPGWHVHERYPDSANLAGRLDWRDHLDLHTVSRIKKDFDEEVKYCREIVDDQMFFVVVEECPRFVEAIESWRQENGREIHDDASHPMAEFRYLEHNIRAVMRYEASTGSANYSEVARGAGAASDEEAEEDDRHEQSIQRGLHREVVGVGGAEDSPVRGGERRMERQGWPSGFNAWG